MKVYLIRHAQSVYNVGETQIQKELGPDYKSSQKYVGFKFGEDMMDVSITENGVAQCQEAKAIMESKQIDFVIVSPLRRALQTCWEIFKDHPSKPVVVVEPLFKQILESSCDIGSRMLDSMSDYPTFDFSKTNNHPTWYLDTIVNPNFKADAFNRIASMDAQELKDGKKVGLRILDMLKDYHTKKEILDTEEDMHVRHLLQLEELRNNYKGKRVAVVSHSQNLKHFVGWKIKNCEVKEFTVPE